MQATDEENKLKMCFRGDKEDNDPLLNREKFAVSLRNKKRQEILEVKRRRNYQSLGLNYGQLVLIQDAPNEMVQNSAIPDFLATVDQVIQVFNQFDFGRRYDTGQSITTASDVDRVLKGLRALSFQSQKSKIFEAVVQHEASANCLVEALQKAASNLLQPTADQNMEIEIICNALWTLQNLSFDEDSAFQMKIEQQNLHEIDLQLLMVHFINEASQSMYEPGHFVQVLKLSQSKLRLLNGILWNFANICRDEHVPNMLDKGAHKMIHMLVKSYSESFDGESWFLVVWIMAQFSNCIEDDPQSIEELYCFVMHISQRVLNLIQDSETKNTASQNKRLQDFKEDFVTLVKNLFKNVDSQARYQIRQIKNLPEFLISILFQQSQQSKTSVNILYLLGEFIQDESCCSYLIQKKSLVRAIHPYLIYGDVIIKRIVLWVINNIVCNSQADINEVLNLGIFSNVAIAARSDDIKVRGEAIFTIGSLLKKHNCMEQILQTYEIEKLLLDIIKKSDEKEKDIILTALQIQQYIFAVCKDQKVIRRFDESDGIEALENLQSMNFTEIVEVSQSILTEYFGAESQEFQNEAGTIVDYQF